MHDTIWRCVVAALRNIILAQDLTIAALKQEIKDMRKEQGKP